MRRNAFSVVAMSKGVHLLQETAKKPHESGFFAWQAMDGA